MEGWALFNLFNAATFEMDLDRARDLCDDALERFTAAGDQYGIGLLTFTQASLDLIEYRLAGSVREEDAEEVLFRLEPMLEVVRAVGERNVLGHALEVVGTAKLMSHRAGSAACLMADAVDAFDTLGNQSCLAHCLDRVAWLADETARPDDAVRLLAATEALRERIGIAAPPIYAYLRDSVRESASAKMFSRRFDTAWQEGGAMDGAAAVGLAHGIAEATSA